MLVSIPHDEQPRLILKRNYWHSDLMLLNLVKIMDVKYAKMASRYSIWAMLLLHMGDAAAAARVCGDWVCCASAITCKPSELESR
jgi:hypothetical protein